MITIKKILNDKKCLVPESVPGKYFGQHFDGEKFYFFESDEEHQKFLDALPKQEVIKPKSELLIALENASDEEKQAIKELLK